MYLRTIIVCLLLLNGLTGTSQITDSHYKIYSVASGKEVTPEQIAEEMKNYDVLFFGEEHNDSVAHHLQQKMLELLYQKYESKVTLSMEMFDRDVQMIMNEYLSGAIREKNFTKDARAWSNYRDYRPMVEFAKSNNLDIVCANSPSRYTNLAGRKGQKALMELSPEVRNYFAPLPYDTASGKYYDKLVSLTMHDMPSSTDSTAKMPVMMPMGGFNLIMAQSLWDATMAWSISEYLKKHKGHKILQLNGRFHSDERFAIVTQLEKYRPNTKTLVISSGTDESFPEIEWNKHSELGDYIIITDPDVPKTFSER